MSTPEKFLPLTPTVFEILLALVDGQRHGYAIILEVAERTEGRVRLRAGSLYRALPRLIRQGLIEESDERPDGADDERRRYYFLTPLGRQVAACEARRLAAAVEGARRKRLIESEETG